MKCFADEEKVFQPQVHSDQVDLFAWDSTERIHMNNSTIRMWIRRS